MCRIFRQGGGRWGAHLKTSNLTQIEASATLYLYFDPIKCFPDPQHGTKQTAETRGALAATRLKNKFITL